jgi:hypothetical protein
MFLLTFQGLHDTKFKFFKPCINNSSNIVLCFLDKVMFVVTMSNNSCFYCTLRTAVNNNDVTNCSTTLDSPTISSIDQLSLDSTTEKSNKKCERSTTASNSIGTNQWNRNRNNSCNNSIIQILRPDSEKKSVFWFDPPESISSTTVVTTETTSDVRVQHDTTSDIHHIRYHTLHSALSDNDTNNHHSQYYECNLQCRTEDMHRGDNNDDINRTKDSGTSNFMIGGFQLISNAKQIDVYITTPSTTTSSTSANGSDKNETLLTTVRGIPIGSTTDVSSSSTTSSISVPKLYKAQCVIPGGPRLIFTIRLVFQSLYQSPNTSISAITTTNSLPTDTFIDNHGNENISNPLYLEYIRWTVRNVVAPTTTTTMNTASAPTTTTSTTIPPNSSMMATSIIPLDAHSNNSIYNANTFNANTSNSSHNKNNNEVLMALSGMVMTIRGMEDRVQQRMMKDTNSIQQQLSNIVQQINTISHSIQQIQQQQNEQFLLLQQQQEQIRSLLQCYNSTTNNNNSSTTTTDEKMIQTCTCILRRN